MKYFWDKQHGGGYWSVDYLGKPKEKHKQMYGQGFMLYGLSEYYRAFGDKNALNSAIELFKLIEKHGYDIAFSTRTEYMNKCELSNRYQYPRFEVMENVSFAENICRMTGVWFKTKSK